MGKFTDQVSCNHTSEHSADFIRCLLSEGVKLIAGYVLTGMKMRLNTFKYTR